MGDPIQRLDNWEEVIRGFYIYRLNQAYWYEIMITQMDNDLLPEHAIGSLYVVGSWDASAESISFRRESLIEGSNVAELLSECHDHYRDHLPPVEEPPYLDEEN